MARGGNGGKVVTPKDVAAVKEKARRMPTATHEELGAMVGFSKATIAKILAGHYDTLTSTGPCKNDVDIVKAIDEIEHQIKSNRDVVTSIADGVTLADIYDALSNTNNLLAQVVFMLANEADPNHQKSSNIAAHFRDMGKKYQIITDEK